MRNKSIIIRKWSPEERIILDRIQLDEDALDYTVREYSYRLYYHVCFHISMFKDETTKCRFDVDEKRDVVDVYSTARDGPDALLIMREYDV